MPALPQGKGGNGDVLLAASRVPWLSSLSAPAPSSVMLVGNRITDSWVLSYPGRRCWTADGPHLPTSTEWIC